MAAAKLRGTFFIYVLFLTGFDVSTVSEPKKDAALIEVEGLNWEDRCGRKEFLMEVVGGSEKRPAWRCKDPGR